MSAPKAEVAGLTVERREELQRVAEAATPGPWLQEGANYGRPSRNVRAQHQGGWPLQGVAYLVGRTADAAHIAAFDPPTVLALLDALAAAEAERDEARAAVERGRELAEAARGLLRTAHRPTLDSATAQVNGAALDRFRAALDTASSEGA